MKKILFVLFSLSLVSVLLLNIVSAKGEQENDLFKMASILKDEDILINQWSLQAREKVESGYRDHYADLMKQFPELEWKISQDEDKWEATAIFSKEKEVNETIRILSTGTETYIIYEVKGTGWGNHSKEYIQETVSKTINDIFHQNVTIFSCIMGEFDDKMNEALPVYANALLTAFQAEEVEKLEENSFISTSAYTPMFNESIEGTSGAMNLQVGIREEGLGGKTTVVVGTPIITIEY
jgi:nitrogen regulatory protein PII-like uncharacterized protein